MSFPRYPKYKDSGVEWLGEVPEHWEVKRLGSIFRQVNEPGEDHLAILCVSIHDGVSDKELGEEEMDRKVTRSDDRSKYKKVEPGDLVYNMMRAWQGGFGAVAVHGMVSPAYVVARPISVFSTAFIEHLLRTPPAIEEMRRYSQGVTDFRLRLYWEEFKTIAVVLPPSNEQVAITEFLEQETAKIDELVAEQQRLIELLKEKRQAVISHAVTKGLNPHAPMKPSGIEWLGDVPVHWEVSRFGYISSVVRGGSPRPAGDPALFNGDYSPWVTVTEITKDDRIELTDTETFLTKKGSEQCRVFSKGTLLLSNSGGSLGVPKILQINANANDGVIGFENLSLDPRFAYFYLSTLTHHLRGIVRNNGGSTQINLNTTLIKQLPVPIPPTSEIQEIVEHISRETELCKALTVEAQRAIDLLQERRTALISAAVTGQIDVRHLAENEVAA